MAAAADPALDRLFAPFSFHWDLLGPGPQCLRFPWEPPGGEGEAGADDAEAGSAHLATDGCGGALPRGGDVADGKVAVVAGGRGVPQPQGARRKEPERKGSGGTGGGLARGFLIRAAGGGPARASAGRHASAGEPDPSSTPSSSSKEVPQEGAAGGAAGAPPQGRRKKVPAGYYWTTPPARYEFAHERPLKVDGWLGVEQAGEVRKPTRAGACHFYRLPGLVDAADVERILAHCKGSNMYKSDADSVDQTPTFEYYPFRDGEWVDEGMRGILEGVIDSRVLPYVRERYGCRFCAVSDVLVRRYLPGERRTHAVHFDGHAFVTAVLGLSHPDEYEGGLYLQPEPDVASRMFFRIEPGDLVVHSFDLQHGVHVWRGVRYSMIFWIKDSLQSVRERTTPWYQELADLGDPDALYNLAQNFEYGLFGKPADLQRAIELSERSARAGHHFAQNNLGLMLKRAHAKGLMPDGLEKSCEWLRQAAEAGLAIAQKNLGLAYANGQGVKRNDAQAVVWMRRAAEQLEVEAAYMMGELYRQGRGVPMDSAEAARWYERSAEAGFPKAQYTLGMLYLEGTGVEKDLRKAEMWLQFAARQGNAEAKNNLATLHAQRGDVDKAAEIWWELAKAGEPNAQCNIGMCFMRGAGRPVDLGEARRWLGKAAKQGHQMAAQALMQLGAAA